MRANSVKSIAGGVRLQKRDVVNVARCRTESVVQEVEAGGVIGVGERGAYQATGTKRVAYLGGAADSGVGVAQQVR